MANMMRRIALCTLLLAPSALVHGQSTLPAPRGEFMPYALDSGERIGAPPDKANPLNENELAWSAVVHAPEAAWIRLYFAELTLAGASSVRVTSLFDGQTQTLDALAASEWRNTTAYFNGDRVRVELLAAPGSRGNRARLTQLAIERRGQGVALAGAPGECGICGGDSRTPSAEPWSARMMPVGCTASVYNICSGMVSAGHCTISEDTVVQFNVPNSLPDCTNVNPPVADQFPILNFARANDGVGNDWAVFRTGHNSLGQRVFERYGAVRPIATAAPFIGNAANFYGYGSDVTCVLDNTQQFSFGTVMNVASTSLTFNSDVRGGSSGSGILHDDRIIGIATHCNPGDGCTNYGTRIDHPAFVFARQSECPCTPIGVHLDVGTSVAGAAGVGAPISTFTGAAAQPGFWNDLTGVNGSIELLALSLGGTPITVTRSSITGSTFSFDNPNTSGEFAKLLDDAHIIGPVGNSVTYTFDGVPPGRYTLYTYAIAPHLDSGRTNISVSGSTSPSPQTVGGVMPVNALVEGVTHSAHRIIVTSNTEQFTVTAATAAVVGAVSGFQLKPRPGCPGDIVPAPGDDNVNADDLVAVILAWGQCPQPCPPACPGDIPQAGQSLGDCLVNADDLVAVILNWGPCQ